MAGEGKTEKASPTKLREARERGDIPTSPEFTSAALALVALFVLQSQAGHILDGLQSLVQGDLSMISTPAKLDNETLGTHVRSDTVTGLLLLLPLVVAITVGALVIGLINTRGLLSLKSITPSFRKLNPLNGVKHLFGKEAGINLLKTLIKAVISALFIWNWYPTWVRLLPQLSLMNEGAAAGTLWAAALHMAIQLTAAFLFVAGLDYGYRQYAWRKRQRMSKHDQKEEFKRMEGNPQMRSRMRQTARRRLRAILQAGGIRKVPQADVVITNPTHFAIAIQYKAGKMGAPKVIAKGQNLIALRIKDAARIHNIVIVENKPLAQALYKSVEVNQEIPADLYQAVAQVLAFVYRLRAPRRPAPRRGGPALAGLGQG
jgi:flagellar biosynthetic protein FlhB